MTTVQRISTTLQRFSVFLFLAAFLIGCAGAQKETSSPPAPAESQASDRTDGASLRPGQSQPGSAPAAPAEKGLTHEVRYRGETLSVIAKWYTGSYSNWTQLAELNPNLDPDRIYVGDLIFIPDRLLEIRTPMPRDFVQKHVSQDEEAAEATPSSTTAAPPETAEEPPSPSGPETKSETKQDAQPAEPEIKPRLFGPKPLRGL